MWRLRRQVAKIIIIHQLLCHLMILIPCYSFLEICNARKWATLTVSPRDLLESLQQFVFLATNYVFGSIEGQPKHCQLILDTWFNCLTR